MSGGNPFWTGRLSALACVITLCAGMPVGATGQTGLTGEKGLAFETGIATANIGWDKPKMIDATFASIAGAGFASVRIGLKNPLTGTYRALEQAKQAGLNVLVTIPLIDGAVADKDAAPRPRNDRFFPAYGLSQIDLNRYRMRLEDLLAFVDLHQIPLIGLELGNEPNWSGYNGDLPLSQPGRVIKADADWTPGERLGFEAGLDRYRAVIETTRATLGKHPTLSQVKLISAGLADINADFIRRSGATYVAPELVYRAFAARQVFQQSDIVGIHLYEPLRNANNLSVRTSMIHTQLAACAESVFASKPCWITEFGAALPQQDCAASDTRRIALMQPLLKYLAILDNTKRIPMGFYYDWNDDAGFALTRCGRLTDLVKILPRQNHAEVELPGAP